MKEPGGRIHGTLAQVAAALPSDAKVVSRYDVGTVRSAWPASCRPVRTAGQSWTLTAATVLGPHRTAAC